MFVAGLDQTVVVAVLPRITNDLRLSVTELDKGAWLVTAYLLGFTVALPLLARAADVHGQRALFAACAVVFAGGSLWAALARTLWPLVGARAVQAAGGGGMVPVALAAAASLYGGGRARILALGAIGAAAEAGGVLGPLYGALMLRAFGWRSVFWVNLPLAALLVGGAALTLRGRPERRGRVDYVGGLLAGLALLALALALSGRAVPGVGSRAGALYAAAATLALAFTAWERRARWPLLPLGLFRRAELSAANAASLLTGVALIVALVEVPLFSTLVLGRSATDGGLVLVRLTALIPVGALLGAWLADSNRGGSARADGAWLGGRVPLRAVAAAGMVVAAAGFVRLSRWDTSTHDPALSLDLALTGLGFGLVLAPLAATAVAAARGSEAVAAGTLTIGRTLGMMIGLASLTTWALTEFRRRVATVPLPLPEPHQSARAYHALVLHYEAHVRGSAVFVFDRLFLVSAAVCLAAGLPALLLRERERPGL